MIGQRYERPDRAIWYMLRYGLLVAAKLWRGHGFSLWNALVIQWAIAWMPVDE